MRDFENDSKYAKVNIVEVKYYINISKLFPFQTYAQLFQVVID